MRNINFNAQSILGRINAIESTQIRYAGTQSMKRLGFQLRNELSKAMAKDFNNPVPFTLNSPLSLANGLSVVISINADLGGKGQEAATYLYPVSTQDSRGRKPAYATRFQRGLWELGVIPRNNYVLSWLPGASVPRNSYGNTSTGFLQAVLQGLKNEGGRLKDPKSVYGGNTRYFSQPDNRRAVKGPSRLSPGIYRVKGNQLDRLFGYVDRQPTVPTKFDFEGIVRNKSADLLPGILRQELDRAMR